MGSLDNNKQDVFDIVVLDYRMPGTNGMKLLKK